MERLAAPRYSSKVQWIQFHGHKIKRDRCMTRKLFEHCVDMLNKGKNPEKWMAN
jgi:hypothetical protein